MLTIGTGIGGCILLNGEVFHGFSNSACEVGYMHMDDSDFQTLGAASILTKKVAAWKEEPTENWSGYHIFEEAKKDDEICNRAIDEMVDVLGKGIANICYVVNPEVVVLGGGIMAQEAFLKDKIEKQWKIPGVQHVGAYKYRICQKPEQCRYVRRILSFSGKTCIVWSYKIKKQE